MIACAEKTCHNLYSVSMVAIIVNMKYSPEKKFIDYLQDTE